MKIATRKSDADLKKLQKKREMRNQNSDFFFFSKVNINIINIKTLLESERYHEKMNIPFILGEWMRTCKYREEKKKKIRNRRLENIF